MAVRYSEKDLLRFGADALQAVGSSPSEARLVSECLVGADARGIHSHGVLRLSLYVESVQAGGIIPNAPMTWRDESGAIALLDAAGGFGQPAVQLAIEKAEEIATTHGVATVGVHRSTHYGAGAFWAERITKRGLAGCLVSGTGPCVAPFGSREGILGTNPITFGIPVKDRPPLIVDMATSVAAYGKIVAARSDHRPIPEGWALDGQGRPTTDPAAALEGALRPVGDHKGSGLSIVVEVLASALTSSAFSYEVTDIQRDRRSQMAVGHTLVAWDFSHFGDRDAIGTRIGELAERIQSAAPADGFDRVRLPGEVEHERRTRYEAEGIPVPGDVPADLRRIADLLGVEPPQPIGEAPA